MKPAFAIFGWILLGAIAAGGGTGFFLYESNKDRLDLIRQKTQAEARSTQLITESQNLATEANKKLDRAAEEIKNAEDHIHALEAEQELIAKAKPIGVVSATNRWPEHLSIPLGLSIHMPTAAKEIQNDDTALVFQNQYGNETAKLWLTIEPYNSSRETEWNAHLEDPSPILFLVQGHVLAGTRGMQKDGNKTGYVFRVQMNASSTHLIWASTDRIFDGTDLEHALGTLTLR